MQHKLKQFINRYRLTSSNRLPPLRSRQFLINELRLDIKKYEKETEICYAHETLSTARGLLRWKITKTFHKENRICYRAGCLLTGRNRGVSGRYNVSRIQIKGLSDDGKLIGARKSSW